MSQLASKSSHMKYDPTYHHNHGEPFTEEDYEYICKFSGVDGIRSVGFALGRTEKTISTVLTRLKREGMFEHYRTLDKYYV